MRDQDREPRVVRKRALGELDEAGIVEVRGLRPTPSAPDRDLVAGVAEQDVDRDALTREAHVDAGGETATQFRGLAPDPRDAAVRAAQGVHEFGDGMTLGPARFTDDGPRTDPLPRVGSATALAAR